MGSLIESIAFAIVFYILAGKLTFFLLYISLRIARNGHIGFENTVGLYFGCLLVWPVLFVRALVGALDG